MSLTEDDKTWIKEQLEQTETRLLTAFHGWASPVDARVRSHATALHALDLEMDALTDRLKKLEDKRGAQ
jgi:hypothetical protein